MNNDFPIQDQISREAFKLHYETGFFSGATGLYFFPDRYSPADGYYYSAGTKVVFELKLRNYKAQHKFTDPFPPGWILEIEKYSELKSMQENEDEKCQYLYINIFTNAVVAWDLTHMTIDDDEWKIGVFNRNHVNKMHIKVEKRVYYFHVKDCFFGNRLNLNYDFITKLVTGIIKSEPKQERIIPDSHIEPVLLGSSGEISKENFSSK